MHMLALILNCKDYAIGNLCWLITAAKLQYLYRLNFSILKNTVNNTTTFVAHAYTHAQSAHVSLKFSNGGSKLRCHLCKQYYV